MPVQIDCMNTPGQGEPESLCARQVGTETTQPRVDFGVSVRLRLVPRLFHVFDARLRLDAVAVTVEADNARNEGQ